MLDNSISFYIRISNIHLTALKNTEIIKSIPDKIPERLYAHSKKSSLYRSVRFKYADTDHFLYLIPIIANARNKIFENNVRSTNKKHSTVYES